jgi:hypothetical protein
MSGVTFIRQFGSRAHSSVCLNHRVLAAIAQGHRANVVPNPYEQKVVGKSRDFEQKHSKTALADPETA